MRALLHDVVQQRLCAEAAVPAFTCYDAATAVSIVEAAEGCGLPVVILVPPSLPRTAEGRRTVRAFRSIADDAAVPVVVQLDHATDRDVIATSLEDGVDAVLADGSAMANDENAAFVRSIRALADPGITIEAELGNIAGDEDRSLGVHPDLAGLTRPDEAAAFIEDSGCDLLAVAVGNVHGRYRGRAFIDRPRLASIREVARVPLVLHGASGLPPEDLMCAGALGVGKVNVNTELRKVMLDVLESALPEVRADGDDIARLTLMRAGATGALATALMLRLTGSAEADGPD